MLRYDAAVFVDEADAPGDTSRGPRPGRATARRARHRRHAVPRARLRAQRVRRRGRVGPRRAGGRRPGRPGVGRVRGRASGARSSTRRWPARASRPPTTWCPGWSRSTGRTPRPSSCWPTPGPGSTRLAPHVALAVVTDGPLASQQAKAEALLLSRWADLIVFTETLGPGRGKPHPAAFEQLEREVGLRRRPLRLRGRQPGQGLRGAAPARVAHGAGAPPGRPARRGAERRRRRRRDRRASDDLDTALAWDDSLQATTS